jgi:predicted metal-dependent phosphoesterase TrpH
LPLKIDLHVHTCYSKDSIITLESLLAHIRKNGLDGVAITDHNTVKGALRIVKVVREAGEKPIVIPGIEVSTETGGHILGINVTTPIPRKLSIEETVERIHEAGGLAVAAHPETLFKSRIGLSKKMLSSGLDAIEVVNSSLFPFKFLTQKCKRFADYHNLPQTAGSDSHIPEAIGLAYTIIDSDEEGLDNIIESIKRGLTIPTGRSMPLPLRIKDFIGKHWKSKASSQKLGEEAEEYPQN